MKPFERLIAWQHCHTLVLYTYRITQQFPKSELYGITSQMRRAASSAAANIAEGVAKRGRLEFRRYLDITLGSLSELAYFARLAHDLRLLSDPDWAEFERLESEAGKTTMGLYKVIARREKLDGRRALSNRLAV
jgi:four helix bundle protein